MFTPKIAACSGKRKCRRARHEMVEWLFFNRVNAIGNALAEVERVELSFDILPHMAIAISSFLYVAPSLAQKAGNSAVWHCLPEFSFPH
jgi:hypothetical protein